MHDIISFNGIT